MDIDQAESPIPIDTSSEHSDSDTTIHPVSDTSIYPISTDHIDLEPPEPFLHGWSSVDLSTYPYPTPFTISYLNSPEMSSSLNSLTFDTIPNQSSITQLSKYTFHDWKLRLKTSLGAAGLSDYILLDQCPPTDPKEKRKFETNDLKALSVIQATVDKNHFQIIAQCENARSAFTAITRHFEDSGGIAVVMVFYKLVTLKLSSDASLSEHLHQFQSLHNELISTLRSIPSLTISDPFIAVILLKSLPPSFDSTVQNSLASFSSITLQNVLNVLTRGESWYASNSDITSDTALATTSSIGAAKSNKSKNKKKEFVKKEDVVYCSLNHPGHNDDSCYSQIISQMSKELAEIKGKSNIELAKMTSEISQLQHNTQQLNVSSTPPESDLHPSYYDQAFCANSDEPRSQMYIDSFHYAFASTNTDIIAKIIFDSGASSHMFKDASLFKIIKAIPPTKITVASKDGGIWATHKGSVHFRKLNLENFLYSDQLTSNLVSIGRLCDVGYSVVFQSSTGYILDQQQKIVMTLARDVNSDRLWHPNMDESAFLGTASPSTPPNSTLASLWHWRLGHLHPDAVIQKLKDMGGPRVSRRDFLECEACICGKMS